MKILLIEMLASGALAFLFYYGLVFAGMTDPRWTAALAVLLTGLIIAVGKRVLRARGSKRV